jgi:hypothetical protein
VSSPRWPKGSEDSPPSDRSASGPSFSHRTIAALRQLIRISESMANGRSGPPRRTPHSSDPKPESRSHPPGSPEPRFVRFACPLASGFPTLAVERAASLRGVGAEASRLKSTAIPAASRRARRRPSSGSADEASRMTASSRTTSLVR